MKYSRRHWLKGATALAVGSGGIRAFAAESEDCPMGFGTYGLPGYSLQDSIRLIADTGFASIEFASMPGYHGAPDQISAGQRKQIRELVAAGGLKIGALMGLPTPDAGKQTENIEWVKQMLQLANDLAPDDPPMIQSVLGGGQWAEKKNLFRDCLGSWIELAADSNVELSIKPHRGHAMSLPEQAVWLIEELDAAGKLSLVYDYSHYVFRDLKLEDTIAAALPHTGYLVVKDAVQDGAGVRFLLPGESGQMPHARILKMFHDGGYRGEVCCEVSSQVWKAEAYDPRGATETCYRNLSQIYSAAGIDR